MKKRKDRKVTESKEKEEEIPENKDSPKHVKKIKERFESKDTIQNLKPKFLKEQPQKGSRERERKRGDIPRYDQSSIDLYFKKKDRLETPKTGKKKLENT